MPVNFDIINQKGSPAIYSDVFANRPTASYSGRLFISTDTKEIYRDTGSAWEEIAGQGSGNIQGSGTASYVPRFTDTETIGNSNIRNDGSNSAFGGVIDGSYQVTVYGGQKNVLAAAGGQSLLQFGTSEASYGVYDSAGANAFLFEKYNEAAAPFSVNGIYALGGFYTKVSDGATNRYNAFFNDGNIAFNSVTNAGFKADINGTLRVTGLSTLSGGIDLGTGGIETEYVDFNLAPTSTLQEGRAQWNATDGTLDIRLKGNNVTLQVGQEFISRVRNDSGSTMLEANYQVVYISGATGNRMDVDLAIATNGLSNKALGLVTEDISNNQEGFITSSGLVRGINTTGSLQSETWNEGDLLYLSATTAGQLTKTSPVAPNHSISIGVVVKSHINQGSIYVKVGFSETLSDISNVLITAVADNDLLVYNSATSLWKNETIESVIGGTPITGSGTTNYVPKFTSSSAIGNSLIYDNGTIVGIGTSSPSSKLQINEGDSNGSQLRLTNTRTGGSQFIFGVGDNGSNSSIAPAGGYFIYDINSAATRLVINSSGNILIGTTTDAGYKCLIQGSTHIFGQTNIGQYDGGSVYPAQSGYALSLGEGSTASGKSLFCNGAIAIGNTVSSGIAVASTHKVQISIGGTTYYLLATNV